MNIAIKISVPVKISIGKFFYTYSLIFWKFYEDIAASQNFFQIGGIINRANSRVAVICREVFVKNHKAIWAEQH